MLQIDRQCRYCKCYSPIKGYPQGLVANCIDPNHKGEIVLGLAEGCNEFTEDPEKVGKLPLATRSEGPIQELLLPEMVGARTCEEV